MCVLLEMISGVFWLVARVLLGDCIYFFWGGGGVLAKQVYLYSSIHTVSLS